MPQDTDRPTSPPPPVPPGQSDPLLAASTDTRTKPPTPAERQGFNPDESLIGYIEERYDGPRSEQR